MLGFKQVHEYFKRIGKLTLYKAIQLGAAPPNLDTLKEILFSHSITFPFENLDMHNVLNNPQVNPTPVEINAIFEKMVRQGRGGYCFETNELLRQLLLSLGFDVKIFNAGVIWLKDKKLPACHEVLIVKFQDKEYLVEPGFGSPSPMEPLLFRTAGVLNQEEQVFLQHDVKRYRFILDEDGEYQLQAQVNVAWRPESPWKPLYAFKTQVECSSRELIEGNYLVSASEQSPFLQRIFVTIPIVCEGNTTGRKTLTHNLFKISTPEGVKEIPVESQEHFFHLLKTEFNITLAPGSNLEARQVKFAQPDLQAKLASMLASAAITMPPAAPVQAAPAPTVTVAFDVRAQQADQVPFKPAMSGPTQDSRTSPRKDNAM